MLNKGIHNLKVQNDPEQYIVPDTLPLGQSIIEETKLNQNIKANINSKLEREPELIQLEKRKLKQECQNPKSIPR